MGIYYYSGRGAVEKRIFNIKAVKEYIKTNKLTIKQFCLKCGISYYNYRQFMNDDLNITIPNVYFIARGIGINLCEMFNKN